MTGMESPREPMIEGERASLILAAVLSMRVCGRHGHTLRLAGTADPRSMAALIRAVDRLEKRMRSLGTTDLVDQASSYAERRGEAFAIVAQRAMDAYGMTVAPWAYQLSDAS